MRREVAIFTALTIILTTSVSAVGPATYEGNLQVEIEEEQKNFQAGEVVNVDLPVANSDNRPIVDGYLVVNIVKGGEAYYPSQQSNKDNIFHQEKIKNIYLKAGNSRELSYSYELPENIKSGSYRVEAYFKTNRTPVTGLPFIYSTPIYETFQVSGSGNYPSLEISRTKTILTGIDEKLGDWTPNSTNFDETKWPSLTGPVGVLTTSSMNNVKGKIVIQNHVKSSKQAKLKVAVCEWDDTACKNRIDTLKKRISIPATGTEVPIKIKNPSKPGAYAVKIKITSNGETQSIYRNRIIRKGNTSRIRKLSVNQPYIKKNGKLSVGVVAGASADHYTDPSAVGVKAHVTVETLEGTTILDETKTITRLSNANVFEKLYFNTTVNQAVSEFRVSAKLSANGKIYDKYSYLVDYSKFQSEMAKLELKNYKFTKDTLKVNLCGKTKNGIPASGEVQTLLMNNGSISAQKSKVIDSCENINFNGTTADTYNLIANYGSQKEFNITRSSQESSKSSGNLGLGKLPVLPLIAAFLLVLVLAAVLYFRGDKK